MSSKGFIFEGQHKSKQVQDYRGANRNEDAASLIRRNREDRQRRQTQRLQNEAATTIQSFIRGSLARSAQKRYTRDLYDGLYEECQAALGSQQTVSPRSLMTMMRALNRFYFAPSDKGRLVQLSNLLVTPSCRSYLEEWLRSDQCEFRYALGRFLYLVVSYLGGLPFNSESRFYAMPLRLLELCLDPSIVTAASASASASSSPTIGTSMGLLVSFLARKGYFRLMALFFSRQTPTEHTTAYDFEAFSRLPRVASLLSLFLAPLRLAAHCSKSPQDTASPLSEVLRALCSTLYTPEPHLHFSPDRKVFAVLSGAVANTVQPEALLGALLSMNDPLASVPSNFEGDTGIPADRLTVTSLSVPPSLGLLHFLTHWFLPRHGSFSPELCYVLVVILAHLTTHILRPVWDQPRFGLLSLHDGAEDDDDEEDGVGSEEEAEVVTALKRNGAEVLRKALQLCAGEELQDTQLPLLFATCLFFNALVVRRRESVIGYTTFLHVIGDCPGLLRKTWILCLRLCDSRGSPLFPALSHPSGAMADQEGPCQKILVPLLCTFCCCFHHRLLGLHDGELWTAGAAGFPRPELVRMSGLLRDLVLGLVELAHPDTRPELNEDYKAILERLQQREHGQRSASEAKSDSDCIRALVRWAVVFEHVQRLTLQLYNRDRRRQFCPDDHWTRSSIADSIRLDQHSWLRRQMQSKDVPPLKRVPFGYYSIYNAKRRLEEEETPVQLSTREARQVTILTELPCVLPFSQRVRIFYSLVQEDRRSQQGSFENQHMYSAIRARVRRSHLYEDAFEKLSKENEPSLRLRLKVEFINASGLVEAGVDGGGLAREFLSELLLASFDPNRGFFVYAEDKTLYPNPEADFLAENFRQHYFFMGRMLAKAIYEGLLVELSFANFFLAKVLSRVRGDVDINYLQSLDPEMYRNLLSLKTFEGDVQDLNLDFTVMNARFGRSEVVDLKPGGTSIPVTSENRVEYIHLMAHHKLNRQIRDQVAAFVSGMNDVVPIDWLRMFDAQELQVLISGADVPIDLKDLREYTKYVGCSEDAVTISAFWEVMESFDEKDRRSLLKFVTSCSRPPLFGFRELHPPFSVQLTPETDRLPTASTCVNLLKLPDMKDVERVRDKLTYVIHSRAGFELS